MPPSSDPLIIVHGFLSPLQEAAYIIFGLSGDISISTIPILLEIKRMFFHVFPPSNDLYNPLSSFGWKGCPIAAT